MVNKPDYEDFYSYINRYSAFTYKFALNKTRIKLPSVNAYDEMLGRKTEVMLNITSKRENKQTILVWKSSLRLNEKRFHS